VGVLEPVPPGALELPPDALELLLAPPLGEPLPELINPLQEAIETVKKKRRINNFITGVFLINGFFQLVFLFTYQRSMHKKNVLQIFDERSLKSAERFMFLLTGRFFLRIY
jgi:hypothetical protein